MRVGQPRSVHASLGSPPDSGPPLAPQRQVIVRRSFVPEPLSPNFGSSKDQRPGARHVQLAETSSNDTNASSPIRTLPNSQRVLQKGASALSASHKLWKGAVRSVQAVGSRKVPPRTVTPLRSIHHLCYTASAPLPQLPCQASWTGTLLVISLFSGVGALLVALLALGISCSAIAVEQDARAVAAVHASFANVWQQPDVRSFDLDQVRRLLSSHPFTAILVAGGSPCQAVSALNSPRSGVQADRAQLFRLLPEIARNCEALVKDLNLSVPVFSLLESAPTDFPDVVAQQMGGPPLTVFGGSFGWVRRTRCFWGQVQGRSLHSAKSLRAPKDVCVSRSHDGTWQAYWQGKKPLPACIHFDGGYAPAFEPAEAMLQGPKAEPFAAFAACFTRPRDKVKGVSQEALLRFEDDSRRFPPFAYEVKNLLWKGSAWRQPNSRERAEAMMIPSSILDGAAPPDTSSHSEAEAIRCSLVGNSSHTPSIMIALICLFQLLPRCQGVPPAAYAGMELRLRSRAHQTAFWPGMHVRCPDKALVSVGQLQTGLCEVFKPLAVDLPPIKASPALALALRRLQVARVDAWLTGCSDVLGPPQWAQQRAVGQSSAALGLQKGARLHKHALPSLLPDGLSKEDHMRFAGCLPSPFETALVLDADASFAIKAMLILGPCIRTWRRQQLRALQCLTKALSPLSLTVKKCMSPEVFAVAATREPVLMSALAILLDWPDVQIGLRFVQGFGLLGEIEAPGLFRGLDPLPTSCPHIIISSGPQPYAGCAAKR